MTVAELFVNLGLKGADQVGKGLSGVKTGLGDVKSMSLEAKAAIIGVVYGLEQMMSHSAQMGTSLTNFNALTGMSARELQQWQYAARQAGVSGEELTGSLKGVQSSMTNMLLGKGAPEGMAMLANKVGFDPARARDTMYVMQQLQKFAQTVPKDVGNAMIKSFGVSEGTIAAMRRNMFTPENFARAPIYSDKETDALSKVDVAWSNLGQKIQMAFGHFTAKHGTQIVSDIERIAMAVIKLTEALLILGERVKVFEIIGVTADKLTDVIKLLGVAADDTTGKHKPGENEKTFGKGNIISGALNWRDKIDKSTVDFFKSHQALIGESLAAGAAGSSFVSPATGSLNQSAIVPAVKSPPAGHKTQNIEVNQTLQFQHDGKDAKKTGGSVHKAVKDAYRQYSAQAQGT